jgi:hypothetical protein
MRMSESSKVCITGPGGDVFAELLITEEEEGWFTGRVVWQEFPPDVRTALAWYDEVVGGQMLSYLDGAAEAVEGFGLQARFPDGSTHKTYSLHVSPSAEVSFRVSPVLPPPELSGQAV